MDLDIEIKIASHTNKNNKWIFNAQRKSKVFIIKVLYIVHCITILFNQYVCLWMLLQ